MLTLFSPTYLYSKTKTLSRTAEGLSPGRFVAHGTTNVVGVGGTRRRVICLVLAYCLCVCVYVYKTKVDLYNDFLGRKNEKSLSRNIN